TQTYILTHKIKHHIQNLLNILPKFNQIHQQINKTQTNQISIHIKLQTNYFTNI
ncbi:flagellar biosynthesis protein FlgM, partial [Enterococcus hirae]